MKTKKAVPTTAKNNELHNKAYTKPTMLSKAKLKEQIGQLLFYLQTPLPPNEQHSYWQVFESCLIRYVDLKFHEVQL
jgi:hypothetical protein